MGLLEPHERHRGRPRQARLSRAPRSIVVHSQDQAHAAARAAASLGLPLTLLSGPGAAAYAGPAWFLAIVRAAASAHPGVDLTAILDCGGQPGRALGALRMGVTHLRDVGPPRARKRLAAIAEALGATIDDRAYDTLDLAGIANAKVAVTAFLRDASSFETPAARAPQDEALSEERPNSPHPEEDRRSVSKDERRKARR